MDERQLQVRGRIGFIGCIATVIYFIVAAFLYDFEILNIPKIVGFSDFMLASGLILITYVSLATIWLDAYFGFDSLHQMKVIRMIFLVLAILEDTLLIFDCIRGESVGIVSITSLCMVNSIAFSLWYKCREYLGVERKESHENE